MLKPGKIKEEAYLHTEGEIATEIYFIFKGICGYVLKR